MNFCLPLPLLRKTCLARRKGLTIPRLRYADILETLSGSRAPRGREGRLEPPGTSDGRRRSRSGDHQGKGGGGGGRLDLPTHLVSQPESVVSTVATLMRDIPLASRDAASCAESFVHVDSTREQRDTLDLQNFTSQSPDVAPVAACVRCSKFCARRGGGDAAGQHGKVSVSAWGGTLPPRSAPSLQHNAARKGRLSCTEGQWGCWWWAAESQHTYGVGHAVEILAVLVGPDG